MNVCISGYFDVLHVGHLAYLKNARSLIRGDGKLIIIVNNANQAVLKKGKEFMPCKERIEILQELRDADIVIESIDDDRTVCKTLEMAHEKYGVSIFANGGDQFNDIIPEKVICERLNIQLVDGLGDKIQSSSWLTGLKPLKK